MRLPWQKTPEDLGARVVFVDTIRPKFWHIADTGCKRADDKLRRVLITDIGKMNDVYACPCVPKEVERESFLTADLVLGWKSMGIGNNGYLISPKQGRVWSERTIEASCTAGGSPAGHRFAIECTCGIYSWKLQESEHSKTQFGPNGLRQPLRNEPNVVLSMAGLIVVAEYGYRAERARIEEIHLNAANRDLAGRLYARYGVPVMVHKDA